MLILREVVASIEDSSSAADANGNKRAVPLIPCDETIPASRAATTAWWTRRAAAPRQTPSYHPDGMQRLRKSRRADWSHLRGLGASHN